MKKIPLTQGRYALVDDADFEWLSQWKWYAHKAYRTYYAVRKKGNTMIRMHRQIMGLQYGDKVHVDHRNGNGLDNQRSNIRRCTNALNRLNTKPRRGCASKYKGVSLCQRSKRWRANIRHNNKQFHIGRFDDEVDAAKAYDKKAKELFGEFAYLNFPKQKAKNAG